MIRLTENVYACLVGETPVLLDTTSERYQMVRGRTGRQLALFLRQDDSLEPDGLFRILNIKSPEGRDIAPTQMPYPPTISIMQSGRARSAWLLLPVVTILLLSTMLFVRHKPLQVILDGLRTRIDRRKTGPSHNVSERQIAAAFCLVQRLLPLKDRCLPYSLAIARMLDWFGHAPMMVIGVRLPIGAHCWVQCEDRVIGDRLDKIEAFEPILAI